MAASHCRAGRLADAESLYRAVLKEQPDNVEAMQGLAVLCHRRDHPEEALALFRQAIALQEQGRAPEAVEHYERALLLNPGLAEVHQNLGSALAQSGRTVDAIAALKRALALKPDYPEALVQVAHLNAELCDWRRREAGAAQVLDLMRRCPGSVPPFNLQAQHSTPAEQLLCAQQWSMRITQGQSPGFTHDRSCSPGRIRLGYLSADFRDHPVAYAIAETIERHDRTRFEVLGYSYGPDDSSALRRRLETPMPRGRSMPTRSTC